MEDRKGRIGIAAILAVLLASAVVSGTVSAMAGGGGDGSGSVATSVQPAAQEEFDLTDPENAEEFDGPTHKTYDASLDPPMQGTTHNVELEVTEKTLEVDKGKS